MNENRIGVFPVAVLLLAVLCPAQTYVLTDDQQWVNAAEDPQAQYLLAISRIKSAVTAGQSAEAQEGLEELRRLYSDLTGPDLDLFMEAEMLYARAKWTKAVKKYREFLNKYPDSEFYLAALERNYSVGAAFLQGQKQTLLGFLKVPAWDTGADLMREVSDKAGTSPLAYRSLKTLAAAQEQKGLYMEAYQTWSEIADRWPTGELGMEALLSMAQTLHTAYHDPESDATVLRGALSYYEDFAKRYPVQAEEYGIGKITELIREQMAYKQYYVGVYYERTGGIQPASLYYQQVVEQWPHTEAAKMAEARIAAQKAGEPFKVPHTTGRYLFKLGNAVLDSWFGLDAFMDLPSPEKGKASNANEISNG